MKTLKSIGILALLGLVVMAAGSRWLWSSRESAILPTLTEINYVDGVTSSIQAQLNAKVDTINGIDPALTFAKITYVDSTMRSKSEKTINLASGYDYSIPAGGYGFLSGSTVMVDGIAYYVEHYVGYPRTFTSVVFVMSTAQAVYTADNFNEAALYSVDISTGNLTEIARTANDGNMWKTNTGILNVVNFTTPVSVDAGLYVVGFVWNASDAGAPAPTLMTMGSVYASSNLFQSNSLRFSASKSATTTLPSSILASTLTGHGTVWGILLR